MVDLLFQECGDGGEMLFEGKDLKTVTGYENTVYLALFGGSDWVGNDLFGLDFRSETETALLTNPLTQRGKYAIDAAIANDLQFLSEIQGTTYTFKTTIVDVNRLEIMINIMGNLFYYYWNPAEELATKELIVPYLPPIDNSTLVVCQIGKDAVPSGSGLNRHTEPWVSRISGDGFHGASGNGGAVIEASKINNVQAVYYGNTYPAVNVYADDDEGYFFDGGYDKITFFGVFMVKGSGSNTQDSITGLSGLFNRSFFVYRTGRNTLVIKYRSPDNINEVVCTITGITLNKAYLLSVKVDKAGAEGSRIIARLNGRTYTDFPGTGGTIGTFDGVARIGYSTNSSPGYFNGYIGAIMYYLGLLDDTQIGTVEYWLRKLYKL